MSIQPIAKKHNPMQAALLEFPEPIQHFADTGSGFGDALVGEDCSEQIYYAYDVLKAIMPELGKDAINQVLLYELVTADDQQAFEGATSLYQRLEAVNKEQDVKLSKWTSIAKHAEAQAKLAAQRHIASSALLEQLYPAAHSLRGVV